MVDEGTGVKPEPEKQPQPEKPANSQSSAVSADLIAKLTQGLRAAQNQHQQQATGITHLSEVFGTQQLS